jgi:hypothetical protein
VLDVINGVQFTNNQYLFPAPAMTGLKSRGLNQGVRVVEIVARHP